MGFFTLLLFTLVLIFICLFGFMGAAFASGAMAQNNPGSHDWYLALGYLLLFTTILFVCYLWVQLFLNGQVPFQSSYLILPGGMIMYTILGAVLLI